MRPSPTVIGVLLVGIAVALLIFLLLGSSGEGPVIGDRDEAADGPRGKAPSGLGPRALEGDGTATGPGRASRTDPAAVAPSGTAAGDDPADGPRLVGKVVDDATGEPLGGAVVVCLQKGSTCPPTVEWLPYFGNTGATGPGARMVSHNNLPDGSFDIEWGEPVAHLVVRRAGFLVASVCDVPAGTPTTVRLRRGARITGTVVRPDGKPVADVAVVANAPRGLSLLPGRHERARTDAEGRFVVEGLLPEAFDLTFTHPAHFDETRPAVPAGTRDLQVILRPAFAVTFVLTTDDGTKPDTPTVEWRVFGEARGELAMLTLLDATTGRGADDTRGPAPAGAATDPPVPDAPQDPVVVPIPAGSFRYAPVKVPAGPPSATFSVKAIGFLPWMSGSVELPREGGETTLEVALTRDLSLGSARISVEEATGRVLSFRDERGTVMLGRRDAKEVPAGVILRVAEAVEFPSLPAGPYRFVLRSPRWAPAVVELDVAAGLLTEARATLRPAAQVRIRFLATESMLVKFRLVTGGETAWPFVARPGAAASGAVPDEADEPGDAQTSTAGAEGILLTGLAPGRYVVEGLSDDVELPPTTVDLTEGETKEIEVAVARR